MPGVVGWCMAPDTERPPQASSCPGMVVVAAAFGLAIRHEPGPAGVLGVQVFGTVPELLDIETAQPPRTSSPLSTTTCIRWLKLSVNPTTLPRLDELELPPPATTGRTHSLQARPPRQPQTPLPRHNRQQHLAPHPSRRSKPPPTDQPRTHPHRRSLDNQPSHRIDRGAARPTPDNPSPRSSCESSSVFRIRPAQRSTAKRPRGRPR